MRIALTGNPNSGKTTMFNALTGRNEKVGNWAGVTVDKKEHAIKKSFSTQENVIAVDLPGAYSMSPFTSEESITSSYVEKDFLMACSFLSTVTPAQFPTFSLRPVRALNIVVFPEFGLPVKAILIFFLHLYK